MKNTVRSKGDVDLEERDEFLGFLTHNMTPLDLIYSLYIHVCAAWYGMAYGMVLALSFLPLMALCFRCDL